MDSIMCIFASAPTSTLITSLNLLAPNALQFSTGEGTGKSLLWIDVFIALTLLQDSVVFRGGAPTQQFLSILLTLAVGAFMTPSMLIHNSELMIPIVATKL